MIVNPFIAHYTRDKRLPCVVGHPYRVHKRHRVVDIGPLVQDPIKKPKYRCPEVHLAVHQRPAARMRLHDRSESGEIRQSRRLPIDWDVDELQSQPLHYFVFVSDCLGMVGKCQKNDSVIASCCDLR